MRTDIRAILDLCKLKILLGVFLLCFSPVLLADPYHYKNVLVGDRAATMGGAYNAVSDDSTGAYYNPAGLSFSYGDSLSGSGNAYHSTKTTYKESIADKDWVRDSTAVLPSFFGMIKKIGSADLAIAYVIPDSIIEHQDEQYDISDSHPTVANYYLSLHSEDRTNMIGPAISFKMSDSFSIGASLFYSYRIYRHQQHQFIVYKDTSADTSYESVKLEEYSYMPKIGIQFTPFEPLYIGLTISKSFLLSRVLKRDYSKIESGDYTLFAGAYSQEVDYPIQVSLGVAAYPSPSLLLAMDVDYYATTDEDLQSVTNIALGGEWFLNATNAIRGGLFTNNDNRPECTESSCSQAKLDMAGLTLGYSSFTRTSSFTLGIVYSTGSGKADVYGDRSVIVDMERESFTLLFAAGYNY
ncbi:aromatic hydrocarbon degradation protein [bacterium]|nr:aromatic hydrocarbon degradation protein [bacterium]